MANTNFRGVSVLLGKDLQAETGCCAFCGQPSSQLDGFRVSCIEESSRSYRWTRWITKDPKKLNAFFAFVHYLPAAVYCYAVVTLRGQSQLLFLWFGLVFIHAFLSRPLLGWTEIEVPLPHCGKHRGIRKTENKEAEHKSRTRRLFQNKHFQIMMIGIPVVSMVFILLYALFVANNGNFYVTYFLVPFCLSGLLVGLIVVPIRLLIDIRRFILSPYGIASEGKLREIWHLDHDYCQGVKEASIAREFIDESCQVIDVGIQTDDRTQ